MLLTEALLLLQVTITLTGAGTDGTKHIAVTGKLMLVGQKRVAWTQLTSTILNDTSSQSSSFTTLKPVDWLPVSAQTRG